MERKVCPGVFNLKAYRRRKATREIAITVTVVSAILLTLFLGMLIVGAL